MVTIHIHGLSDRQLREELGESPIGKGGNSTVPVGGPTAIAQNVITINNGKKENGEPVDLGALIRALRGKETDGTDSGKEGGGIPPAGNEGTSSKGAQNQSGTDEVGKDDREENYEGEDGDVDDDEDEDEDGEEGDKKNGIGKEGESTGKDGNEGESDESDVPNKDHVRFLLCANRLRKYYY